MHQDVSPLPRFCRAATLALALFLAACGGGGGGADGGGGSSTTPPTGTLGPPDNANYLPFATGLRWINSDGRLVRVAGPDAEAGPGAWRLVGTLLDSTARQSFRVTATSIEFLGTRSTDATQRAIGDFTLLRLPVRTGDSWLAYEKVVDGLLDVDRDGRPDRVSTRAVTTVIGYEAIEVAAGRFERALRVRTEDRQTARLAATGGEVSGTVLTDDWYVADLGRVLSVSTQGNIELNRVELVGYRTATRRTDTEAPTVLAFNPAPDRIVNSPVVIVDFSEPMDTVGVEPLVSVVGSNGVARPGRLSWQGQQRLTFELDLPLPADTYRITLEPGLTDRLGNPVEVGRSWSATIDVRGPTVQSLSPAAGARDVSINSVVEIVLDEPAASVQLRVTQGGEFVPGTVTGSDRTWRFVPEQPFRRATRYDISFFANDLALNLGAQTEASFDTEIGRFLATDGPPESMGNWHLEAGDVDADGRIDTVGMRQIPFAPEIELVLFRQRPGGGFDTERIGRPTISGMVLDRFELLDLDGDGRLDVLPNSGRDWWRRLPSGSYEQRLLYNGGSGFSRVQTLRSASGRLDVVGLLDFRPEVMRQTASGVFASPQPLGTFFNGNRATVADVDGDGLDDLIVPALESGSASLVVDYQNPDGSFGRRQRLPHDSLNNQSAAFIRVVDIDANGLPDIVFTMQQGRGYSVLRVMRQTAPGVFAPAIKAEGGGAVPEVADIDGDGRLDVVTGGPSGFVAVYLQQPSGGFGPPELYFDRRYGLGFDRGALALADFNGDGRIDIWAGGVIWLQRPPADALGTAAPAGAAAPEGLRWIPAAR